MDETIFKPGDRVELIRTGARATVHEAEGSILLLTFDEPPERPDPTMVIHVDLNAGVTTYSVAASDVRRIVTPTA